MTKKTPKKKVANKAAIKKKTKAPAKKAPKKAPKAKKKVAKTKVAKKKAPAKKVAKKAPKKAVKKTVKKTAKKAVKKTVKKVAKKKTVKKKVSALKKVVKAVKKVIKKVAKKKAPVKKKAAKKTQLKKETAKPVKKAVMAAKAPKKKAVKQTTDKTKNILLEARKRTKTPSIFKVRSRKNTPVLFTLEDVRGILETKKTSEKEEKAVVSKSVTKKKKAALVKEEKQVVKKRVLGAASVTDILGFNPSAKKSKPTQTEDEAKRVPEKFKKYYKALIQLRTHVMEGLEVHTQETLKRSSKEDAGDLSGYGQHMADAGTDNSDRDFALSLVSSEQEALFEIEEAIQRILAGEYGVCEITGQPIAKDRLMAVPFTRYSLAGQQELERTKKTNQRGNAFSEVSVEEAARFGDEDFEN